MVSPALNATNSGPTTQPVRKRAVTKCGYCGGVGHTRPTCTKIPEADRNAQKRKRLSERDSGGASSSVTRIDHSDAPHSGARDSECEESDSEPNAAEKRGEASCDAEIDGNVDDPDEDTATSAVDMDPILTEITDPPVPNTTVLRDGTTVGNDNSAGLPEFSPSAEQKPGIRLDVNATNGPRTVLDFFLLFWTHAIIDTFVTNTNAYAATVGDKRWSDIRSPEMMRFFGLILFLGMIKVSERRDLWDVESPFFNNFVHRTMKRHRFEDILRNLHWINTAQYTAKEVKAKNKVDCFWRMADLLELLSASCQKYYRLGQHCNVDEGGIPCKAYHSAIQYNGDKPYKWFFKVYMLNCGTTKYLSNFVLFRGREIDRQTDIPASAWPVYKLLEPPMYWNMELICYLDNYFTGLKLVSLLMLRRIHTVGTIRVNRVRSSTVSLFYSKTGPGKGTRGDMKCHKISDGLYVTSWWDKKSVNMIHTFSNYRESIVRNERNKNTGAHDKIVLHRPCIIGMYNRGMGGTDSFDQHLSYYRTSVKTKRWPHTVYFHFMLCCVTNAWILHKLVHRSSVHADNGSMQSFLMNLTKVMCATHDDVEPMSDTAASASVNGFNNASAAQPASQQPNTETRRHKVYSQEPILCDEKLVGGFHGCIEKPATYKVGAEVKENRRRCVAQGCKFKVRTFCRRCNVPLCIAVGDDPDELSCFEKYHKNC